MKFSQSGADWFIPDDFPGLSALSRTTHLGIGAHQDDLEFMALHGILACFQQPDRWFGGVTCTNGTGSSRTGTYAELDLASLRELRAKEQRTAAMIGQYAFMAQLDFSSEQVRKSGNPALCGDLLAIFEAARPEVVYTHNPADKHPTHLGVFRAVLESLRALPESLRPRQVLGCELWRDLDWLSDGDKVVLDVSGHENLAAALNGVFDSQISGGKRYDLAVTGRRRANASFLQSHATDHIEQAWFAMDLTPLIRDPALDPVDWVLSHLDRFALGVRDQLRPLFPPTP